MAVISRQGGDGHAIDCSPTTIARMLTEVYSNERDIRAREDMLTADGKRLVKGEDGKLHWRPIRDLVGDTLKLAREKRDEHIADLRHAIDYALTQDAYRQIPCPDCKLPANGMDFIREVADFEPVDACETCRSAGIIRVKKDDDESQAAVRRIKYFRSVLDDVILCAKIRAGTSERHEAYATLEQRNRRLLTKFGNESQTSMEGEDAEQGVRMGIIDAAMRFDPTRSEGATFGTVAFNWCLRNSRARHDHQKRAGVYAPSVEAMGTDEDGNGMAELITDTVGACGTFGASGGADQNLKLDIAEHVGRLPEVERSIVQMELTGYNVAQIARGLGLPQARVRRLRASAFEKLREGLVGYMLRE
ncbi:MAG: sigma-70 family RNA polymerase sigma factor [Nitrospira sp.]